MINTTTIRNEIEALRANGTTDILVSINSQGEAVWGEATALSRQDMEREIRNAYGEDGDTSDMITAEEFERRY